MIHLDPCYRKSESFFAFKISILEFIQPSLNDVGNCQNLRKFVLLQDLDLNKSFKKDQTQNIISKIRNICHVAVGMIKLPQNIFYTLSPFC